MNIERVSSHSQRPADTNQVSPATIARVREELVRQDDPLSAEERTFFEHLFPNSRQDLQAHTVYGKRGKMTTQPVGGLIDRRG